MRASRTIAAMAHNPRARLLLDERILSDGTHARTYASFIDGHVRIEDEPGMHGALSVAGLDRVMVRYGLPLEDGIAPTGDVLELDEGRRLRRMRYHAPVDATGRDYLVWERPGEPPLAVIATHATAALRYLVLRIDGERGG
jgi:hypothetical protein